MSSTSPRISDEDVLSPRPQKYGSVPRTPSRTDQSKEPWSYSRRRSSLHVYRTFLAEFNQAKGAWIVVVLGFLTAVAVGCLVGVVPQVATQKFADQYLPTNTTLVCDNGMDGPFPEACIIGAQDAQTAASYR